MSIHSGQFSISHSPATRWEDALLSGNGEIGLLVFGDPFHERNIFCHRLFYHPRKETGYLPDLAGLQERIKDDCLAGHFRSAAQRHLSALLDGGAREGREGALHVGYQLEFDITSQGAMAEYSRRCDFSTGEIVVRWVDDRGLWERASFVSRADDVIVQRLSAPSSGTLQCRITAVAVADELPEGWVVCSHADLASVRMHVQYAPDDINQGYMGVTRVIYHAGSVRSDGLSVQVSDAEALLLLTRVTRYSDDAQGEMTAKLLQQSLDELPADYTHLLARHVALHGEMYNRVTFDLGADDATRSLSNEALLSRQFGCPSLLPALWERLFASGRYHLISASGAHSAPQLVGVWTGEYCARWGGYYHTDANLNLTVGGLNIAALPELLHGYRALLEEWMPDWRYNAQRQLGCRGFLANGHGPAGPGNAIEADLDIEWPYQYLTGRIGWLLYPLWEYYLVSDDREFLSLHLFPHLREMGWFYEDFLTRRDEAGHLVFVPSISPENTPFGADSCLGINAVFDFCMAKFLLAILVESCDILVEEQQPGEGRSRWAQILAQLPEYAINEDGALSEWAWPGLHDQYDHRHASHLCTVWPLREIDADGLGELPRSAVRALQLREQHATEGAAHGILHRALCACVLRETAVLRENCLRLVQGQYFYRNLFSSHEPRQEIFNSDAINTIPTLLLEMLVSSRPGAIVLLPALPADFAVGKVCGIQCRCAVTITEMRWDLHAGDLVAELLSIKDQCISLSVAGMPPRSFTMKAGDPVHIDEKITLFARACVNNI